MSEPAATAVAVPPVSSDLTRLPETPHEQPTEPPQTLSTTAQQGDGGGGGGDPFGPIAGDVLPQLPEDVVIMQRRAALARRVWLCGPLSMWFWFSARTPYGVIVGGGSATFYMGISHALDWFRPQQLNTNHLTDEKKFLVTCAFASMVSACLCGLGMVEYMRKPRPLPNSPFWPPRAYPHGMAAGVALIGTLSLGAEFVRAYLPSSPFTLRVRAPSLEVIREYRRSAKQNMIERLANWLRPRDSPPL
eukprot:gnl/Spiro4/12305_TR6489_c0_g1_i1.p1 gnl/Spiro4/12305_TR6489_c0_g1~~gnl/Spiro4/12305_TR6489_c0_g1_i1.p1  ORF type:complete len:247 (+),score=40.14 gnl/Spiro4/12305_TR6489_c0_g1_i1:91-831(+)